MILFQSMKKSTKTQFNDVYLSNNGKSNMASRVKRINVYLLLRTMLSLTMVIETTMLYKCFSFYDLKPFNA